MDRGDPKVGSEVPRRNWNSEELWNANHRKGFRPVWNDTHRVGGVMITPKEDVTCEDHTALHHFNPSNRPNKRTGGQTVTVNEISKAIGQTSPVGPHRLSLKPLPHYPVYLITTKI